MSFYRLTWLQITILFIIILNLSVIYLFFDYSFKLSIQSVNLWKIMIKDSWAYCDIFKQVVFVWQAFYKTTYWICNNQRKAAKPYSWESGASKCLAVLFDDDLNNEHKKMNYELLKWWVVAVLAFKALYTLLFLIPLVLDVWFLVRFSHI